MNDRLALLARRERAREDLHVPEFFRPAIPADRDRLGSLLDQQPTLRVHDPIIGQLEELIRVLHPDQRFSPSEMRSSIERHLAGLEPWEYGVWVHYPWDDRLVHLLDETEFVRVRTNRNRNKITSEEQAVLSTKRVGVIGLSVGQSVALTLALERACGELRLADFDGLALSNLNRIRSGLHELGLSKVITTAREIAMIDPFLRVSCFTDGITRENLDTFLDQDGALDVLVEECDSIDIKVLARLKARERGIPVVMDTSDRGMLDVERFDLEPQRPILHGLVEHLDLERAANGLSAQEKLPFAMAILPPDQASERMRASLPELGRTLVTWPQLASAVTLGGGLAADAVRRIALGQPAPSGRSFHEPSEHQPASLALNTNPWK